MLMHCGNITFTYDNEFKEYIKVEWAVSEDILDHPFDVGAGKFLSEKEKKYLLELFKKWDPEHLQLDEGFDDYSDNNGLKNILEMKACRISIMMTSLVIIKRFERWLLHYYTILISVRTIK